MGENIAGSVGQGRVSHGTHWQTSQWTGGYLLFETKIPGNSRSTVEMANNCEEFIKADSDKPFFLYYATSDPHRGGGRANELEHQPDRFGNKPNKGAYPGAGGVLRSGQSDRAAVPA